MTQLGIARVLRTKGEPTDPVTIKKDAAEANKKRVAKSRNQKQGMRKRRAVRGARPQTKGITINIHNHSTPPAAPVAPNLPSVKSAPAIKRPRRAEPTLTPKEAPIVKHSPKPTTTRSRKPIRKRAVARPTVKSRVASRKRTVAKPTVKSRVASRRRTIAKPAVKSRVASRRRTVAKPTVKSRMVSKRRAIAKPMPRKNASKPRAGRKIARGVLKFASTPSRLAAKGLSRLARRIRK